MITHQRSVLEAWDSVPNVNTTFLKPFVGYTNASQWTFQILIESEWDWTAGERCIPVTVQVGKLMQFGKVPGQMMGGPAYWGDSPQGGPDGFALRMDMSVVFPKGLSE